MDCAIESAVMEFRHLRCFVAVAEEDGGDVRKYAAEQGVSDEEALKRGMEEKSKEFVEKALKLTRKQKSAAPFTSPGGVGAFVDDVF